MTLVLNRKDIMSVLKMEDCIEVVKDAFVEYQNKTATLPLRTVINTKEGLALYMPAYLSEMGALACKVVTSYQDNPKKHGIPVSNGKIFLQDHTTGEVICIMEGKYLTAIRTGAASGVATDYLAREDEGQIVGIFGAGIQAMMQLEAVSIVRDISRAIIYDISEESLNKFIDEMSKKLNLEITKAQSAEDVLQADIICTATTSVEPVFKGEMVQEGTHINGIGSFTPNKRELDETIIKRSKLIGDSKEACFNESGDIIIPLNQGLILESNFYGELGEVIVGEKKGRESSKEITIFKSNGLAIQDVATAKLVYDKAIEAQIGTKIDV